MNDLEWKDVKLIITLMLLAFLAAESIMICMMVFDSTIAARMCEAGLKTNFPDESYRPRITEVYCNKLKGGKTQ